MTARPADVSLAHTWKPVRPQVTPTASFRGPSGWNTVGTSWNQGAVIDSGAHRMEAQSQTSLPSDVTIRSASRNREVHGDNEASALKADDYSAFDEDAFAPLQSVRSGFQHPSQGTADPWAGFRAKIPSAAVQTRGEQTWGVGQSVQQPTSLHHSTFASNTAENY